MRLELVTVPAGDFVMGSVEGMPDERPLHRVWVDEFALAVHPVTRAEYCRFAEATGRALPAILNDPRFRHPMLPVVAVTWFEAVAYCEWLSRVTGSPCRLPTEAEREKAALGGGEGLRYPWGDGPASEIPADRPHPVGLDPPNGYGLHNTGDLVHEWCSDWYDRDYYARSPARNPSGPSSGTRRASRGGSWRHRIPFSRCAARSSLAPKSAYSDYGLRVAVGSTER